MLVPDPAVELALAAGYFASAPSDLLRLVRLAAVWQESGKFDPAPARARQTARVNSGKSAIYGTAFQHPVETRSVDHHYTPDKQDGMGGVSNLVGRNVGLESYPLFDGT
jgi:hypothetical protein